MVAEDRSGSVALGRPLWALAVLGALACTARLDGASPSPGPGLSAAGNATTGPETSGGSATRGGDCQAPAPMRRLTNFEYEATLEGLFPGYELGGPATEIPGDVVDHAFVFDNRATTQGLSASHVDAYGKVAERVARLAAADAAFIGCDPASGTDACFEALLASFGERAFRRPLEAEEAARIRGTFAKVKAGLGFQEGMQAAIERILQSPQFLYRLELASAGQAGLRTRLTGRELATRLSYLIQAGAPDPQLRAAAASGSVESSEALRAEALRLLGQPGARAQFQHLFDQWLGLEAAERANKDMQLYPAFSPEIARLMAEETRTFLVRLLLEKQGGFGQLFSADFSYVNASLAGYYGLAGPAGDSFERVQLPAPRAAGLLAHGALASLHATDKTTHPIKRGAFVRTRLLCDLLPPPPANVPAAPAFTGHETARELLAKHTAAPECRGCHELIDSIGLGFENLDAAGRWRDSDVNGAPIDASGAIQQGGDAEGPFTGVVELGRKLAGSEKVRDCVATQFFRFSFGREPAETDHCVLDELSRAVAEGGDYEQLVLALVASDAFQYRTD